MPGSSSRGGPFRHTAILCPAPAFPLSRATPLVTVTIPSGTQDYEEAVAILQQKVAKATQPCRSDDFPSVVINQLLDLVTEDYRSKNRYTTYDAEQRAMRLRPFFGTKEPTEVTATLREQYARSAPAMLCPQL